MASVANIGQLSSQAGVPDGYKEWRSDMNDYVEKKKNFQGTADPYVKVTHKFIKDHDVIYNPITQVYNDAGREQNARAHESQKMTDVLAANRDRQLRYMQQYDIINFDGKLKGLESREDYPKAKPWYYRPGKDTLCDYNVISNLDMQEHHVQPPSKRPALDEKVRFPL